MASLVINKSIPLSNVLSEDVLLLMGIVETKGYDATGQPTGETVGYTLTLVELSGFQRIRVKVPKIKLPITPEELKEKSSNQERVFIELEDACLKPYFNSRTKSVEDSITAKDFIIVDSKF
jgi:hypothetical protein